MKRRVVALALAVGVSLGVGALPGRAATPSATPAAPTGGCLWILTYQLCIPYLQLPS